MVVFFEGRHTHNSEYNIELGDGGNMTCMVLNFIGWLFFLKNPVCGKQRTTTDRTLNELWQEDRSLLLIFESYVSGWNFFWRFFVPGEADIAEVPGHFIRAEGV